jgi:GNAT superfamily N-acetyltransferase
MVRLIHPATAEQWAEARRLVEEYADSLRVDLAFQDFEREIEDLPATYGPPRGAFFLAVAEDVRLGCVALRELTPDTCEMKRLYVAPAGRGRGLGRTLAEAVIAQARRLGYRRMLLDTLPFMKEAQELYRSLGFVPTEAYRFNPIAGTQYLELRL